MQKIWHKIWTNFPLCEFCSVHSAGGTKMHRDIYAFQPFTHQFVQFMYFLPLQLEIFAQRYLFSSIELLITAKQTFIKLNLLDKLFH